MIWSTLNLLFQSKGWKVVVSILSIFLFVSFLQLLFVANKSISLIVDATIKTAPGFSSYVENAYFNGLIAIIIFVFLVLLQIASNIRDRLTAQQYRMLAKTMMSFADGHIGDRYKEQSTLEVNKLGQTFNHMADSLQSLIEELRESERRRKEIVVNVAHDLAGPLTAISGYIETLARKLNDVDDIRQQEYLQIVRKNIGTLTILIGELSDLSKLDLAEYTVQKDFFSLRVLANDIISRYTLEAKERKINLSMNKKSTDAMISADLQLIERVISNLVENSIRYTPESGNISILCYEEKGAVLLEVNDSGIGIPKEELPFIFERFYRVDKDRSRHTGGSGLGLAIVKKIMELHNGEISVTSSLGSGTKIVLKLLHDTKVGQLN